MFLKYSVELQLNRAKGHVDRKHLLRYQCAYEQNSSIISIISRAVAAEQQQQQQPHLSSGGSCSMLQSVHVCLYLGPHLCLGVDISPVVEKDFCNIDLVLLSC